MSEVDRRGKNLRAIGVPGEGKAGEHTLNATTSNEMLAKSCHH